MSNRRTSTRHLSNLLKSSRESGPVRAWLSLRRSPRLPIAFLALVFVLSSLSAILAPVVSQVGAISADQNEQICNEDPSDYRCTGTKENCEAAGLYWIESRSTCSSASPDACNADGGTWDDQTLCTKKGAGAVHPRDYARSAATLNALRVCIAKENDNQTSWGNKITAQNAIDGNWWSDSFNVGAGANATWRVPSYLGTETNETDGKMTCNKILKQGLAEWGYADGQELLCDANIYRTNGGSCQNDKTGEFDIGEDDEPAIASAIRSKAFAGKSVDYKGEHRYAIYLAAFSKGCSAVPANTGTGDRNYTGIKIVNEDDPNSPSIEEVRFEGIPNTETRWVYTQKDYAEVNMSCKGISEKVTEYAPAFLAWLKDNVGVTESGPTGCLQNPNDPACTEDGTTACGVDGIGWIVCPAISFMATLLDEIFKALADNFLRTDFELFKTDSGTYIGWTAFRNIANVAFVLVFIIIIFSQLSGVGISNYGVKKMLPRIVIAAILVNISFFVCQLAVDLSNVLGYSVKDLFDEIAKLTGGSVKTSTDATANGYGIAALATGIIGVAVVSYFYLGALIPVLIGAVIAILMIIILLVIRKALIVLLIIASPLAFVAFLLPNTQSLFTKWRKLFVSLLLLFPIVAAVFGASSLASQIILNLNSGDQVVNQIMAVGIIALPFFVVPGLLKGSLDAAGSIGGKLNGIAGRVGGGVGKAGGKAFGNSRVGQLQNFQRSEREKRRALIQSGQYSGRGGKLNPRNLMSGANNAFNNSAISGKFGDRSAASGLALAEKAEAEDVKAATALMGSQVTAKGAGGEAYAQEQLAQALQKGDSVKARAAYSSLVAMGAGGAETARHTLANSRNARGERHVDSNKDLGNALKQHIISNHADMKGVDNRQMGWATNDPNATLDGNTHLGNLTDAQIASQTPASIAAGDLDSARAQRILQDKNIAPNLKETQRKALEAKAGGSFSVGGTPPSSGGGTPPSAGPTGGGGPIHPGAGGGDKYTQQDNGFWVPK